MKSPAIDPYRIFFPLGIFIGFAGVSVWPLLYFGLIQGYWGLSHAFLQSDGFLLCFIAGFLLTAIPRFTGTENPSLISQLVIAIAVIAGAIFLEFQSYAIAQTLFFIAYVMLVVLVLARYARRENNPPSTFPLIGFALITGLLGALVNMIAAWGWIDSGWVLAGKRSLTEGMTLMLVLGVGGFLGARLLGFDQFSFTQIGGAQTGVSKKLRSPGVLYILAGAIIFFSIAAEYGFGWEWMTFVRAAAATIVIAVTLMPWKLPVVRTTLAWCVWTANLLLLIGLWLVAFLPVYRIDMLHVMFIGGFTLLIFGVGMRVSLSHGGHGLSSEKKNWPLRIGLTCGAIAMLARAGAPFAPASYPMHLMLAGILWMVALAIWGWRLLRLIIFTKRANG